MNSFLKKFIISFLLLSSFAFSNPFAKYQNLKGEQLEYAKKNWIVVPEKYNAKGETFNKCILAKKNLKPDTQKGIECSACSIAFLMRWFGKKADGIKMYHSDYYPCKFELGAYPKVFKDYLEPKGYRVKYYTGSLDDLKNCISKGNPVIVLLIYPNNVLHYVPVVGFDQKYIFIQDSVPKFRNCRNKEYNEKRTYSEFMQMWNVPLDYCQNLFVTVEK